MPDFTHAYITSTGTYLPGPPISNEEIEDILGYVHGKRSRLRKRILQSNGILTRHYALDKQQRSTHQNSDLACAAARACVDRSETDDRKIDMLAVASTQGDLPLPGLASAVQAQLGIGPLEILTTHGVCSAGMMALKSAANQVRLGEKEHALVVASELASRLLKKSRYEAATNMRLDLESEFLRWMLSDGAGSMLVESRPRWRGLSLRIDWIEVMSFASDYDLCMSCGTADQSIWKLDSPYRSHGNGSSSTTSRSQDPRAVPGAMTLGESVATLAPAAVREQSWQDYEKYADAEAAGALLIRQDLRLLEEVVKVGVDGFIGLINAGKISASEIDHFVCHYSSHHFRGRILDLLKLSGCLIPEDRWFTNLYDRGNTGCAAIFIALDELFQGGSLKAGQVVFCVVPESGRFTTAYMKLTVVPGRSEA